MTTNIGIWSAAIFNNLKYLRSISKDLLAKEELKNIFLKFAKSYENAMVASYKSKFINEMLTIIFIFLSVSYILISEASSSTLILSLSLFIRMTPKIYNSQSRFLDSLAMISWPRLHNEKMLWGCVSDLDGEKTREELLSNWHKELSNIIFIHGWTTETLKKIGLNRINFAFLDAQHTKSAVLQEFKFINKRQIKGDMIFFDDVTPNLFDGVCNAVKEIEIKYPYKIKYFPFDRNRGYALATKI